MIWTLLNYRSFFEKVDVNKFPAIKLARMVLNTSGSLGVVFNAAKEIALDRFILKDKIFRYE